MSRQRHRISALQVDKLGPGRHADGGGLYLDVTPTSRKWIFMFTLAGRRREMGLGGAGRNGVSLADARKRANDARALVEAGMDPIEDRKKEKEAARQIPTFGEFVEEWLVTNEVQWRNDKHRAQWRTTLIVDAAKLGALRINCIGTDEVLSVLKPIWATKAETANRLRGRIERILDAAKAKGFRDGENPARWRGHLAALLPPRKRLTRGHHAALPFSRVPSVVQQLRSNGSVGARALEFTILTASRTGEVIGARWSEIDLEAGIWTIPDARMKAGRPHRVPLNPSAIRVLRDMQDLRRDDDYVFPGTKRATPISNMTMAQLLKRLKLGEFTVHGFRSSFRDWAGEETEFAREIIEAALAHVVGDATERAYRRGDALARRRELMNAWDQYCGGAETDVASRHAPQAAE